MTLYNKLCRMYNVIQWSFGVTCWEVYSGGSTPYPGMNDPKTLVDFIHGGGRLDKPTSITCSDEM